MDLFWRQGYEATSLQDLLTQMGINRQSLYDTFGDKRQLFLAALDRYTETEIPRQLGNLESASASLADVRRYFDEIIDVYTTSEPTRSACMMANTAMECAARDPEIAAKVAAHLTRLEDVFHRAIENATASGELRRGGDPRGLARYLTSSAQGLAVLGKSGASRAHLREVTRIVLSVVTEKMDD
jgi:TetR/AcrR family transcriptional repressor of nem operon